MITDYIGTPRNPITKYRRLTTENIASNIQNFIGQRYRQARKSVQIFHYLTNSMPEAADLNIVAESDKYMDDETPVAEFLFKLMI